MRKSSPKGVAHALLANKTPAKLIIPGLTPQVIGEAVEGLFDFDRETPRDKQKLWEFKVPRDPDFDEIDDGIVRKASTDWKMFLHWRPDLEELLRERGIRLSADQKHWFAACEHIWNACAAMQHELGVEMDRIRPGYDFARRVREGRSQHCLRILKYLPRKNVLARDHTDRCAITFHIAESADGLYAYDDWEKERYKTPPSPHVLCFSGQQLDSITRGAVHHRYHGVEDTTDGTKERWAMVFFGKMLKDKGTY